MSVLSYVRNPLQIVRKARWAYLQHRRLAIELTSNTWNGRLTFSSADQLIGKFLYVRHDYERHYVTRVVEFLDRQGLRSPGRDVVLDVGANIGMIAIALVKHGWYQRAIAFEPAHRNFDYLRRNVGQNGYQDAIFCRQLALSSTAGRFDMVIVDENSGGNFLQGPAGGCTERWIEVVHSDTCDAVLQRDFATMADRIGLVWLDIEGHEAHFLAGARQTLAQGMPVVSEFYPRAIERSGTSPAEYLRLVGEHFSHVCTLGENGQFTEYPISAVAELFRQFKRDGTNVIYLQRQAA